MIVQGSGSPSIYGVMVSHTASTAITIGNGDNDQVVKPYSGASSNGILYDATNGILTVEQSGLYYCECQLVFYADTDFPAAYYVYARVAYNGSGQVRGMTNPGSANTRRTAKSFHVVSCSANDTFRMYVNHNYPGSVDVTPETKLLFAVRLGP